MNSPCLGPQLMGILNVNVDSFSDPRRVGEGVRVEPEALVATGLQLWKDGADLVDIGAESASPATPVVEPEAESAALLPVMKGLHDAGVTTSIDTYKAEVASACVAAGAHLINDYSGLADPQLAGICADGGAKLVLTHNPPGVKTKVLDPHAHSDVVTEVVDWFITRLQLVEAEGLPRERVVLDPGIDLGKTPAQSIELLRRLDRLAELGLPLLVAVSRKDFIGALTSTRPGQRDPGTLAALCQLIGQPKVIARVHNVAAARQYIDVASVLQGAGPVEPELSLDPALRRQTQDV